MGQSHNRVRSSPGIVFFPRWVWHPHPCIHISQGPRGSDGEYVLPSAQCTEAANKARRMIFMIRCSFQDLSKSAFIPLYGALVRWPNLVADINHLERIQRLATRLVALMRHLPYKERLGSVWAFIPCSGDDFGMTSLPTSRYSRAFWILIRTYFSFLPLDVA